MRDARFGRWNGLAYPSPSPPVSPRPCHPSALPLRPRRVRPTVRHPRPRGHTTSPWLTCGTEPPADTTLEITCETRCKPLDRQPGSGPSPILRLLVHGVGRHTSGIVRRCSGHRHLLTKGHHTAALSRIVRRYHHVGVSRRNGQVYASEGAKWRQVGSSRWCSLGRCLPFLARRPL
jgi:hypothetical protein